MPFLDTDDALGGRAYYRHWAAEDPRSAVVFLHGFGEHTGVYHRYAFALNARGIDVWAVDQLGHGLSPGERGDVGSIEASSTLADALTDVVAEARPGLPLVAAGHSFGAVVTLFRVLATPDRYRAAVISGAPLAPVAELLDADSSFGLDPGWLSADPFYLDALENDPLAFVDADGATLTRELDRAWDRFGAELPTLAVPTRGARHRRPHRRRRGGTRLRRADRTAVARRDRRRPARRAQRRQPPHGGCGGRRLRRRAHRGVTTARCRRSSW
ncbi:alpha/beta fold hydrolase [Mycolicibacterium grossiae]|uniref:alpha/beta fold hydrolase n=1 Tax=Mycolicibacterium grossiae TaxID=1552759 RepID=UPI000A47B08B|nr:alpha/beta fold hydrolase [Mycolicibacterium grossiae]